MSEGESRFRNKVTWIQFILCVGIVYQHMRWNYGNLDLLSMCQHTLYYLIQTCVPFFFVISGYLYFRTYQKDSAKKKIISRIKSLGLPYLIWNTIYAAYTILMSSIGLMKSANIPSGRVLWKILNSEFSPLWYVKYLMIFSIISTIVYFVLRRKLLGGLFIALMMLFNMFSYFTGMMRLPLNVNENSIIMLNYQYIFYTVGAYAALHFKNIVENPSKKIIRICTVIYIPLLILAFVFSNTSQYVIVNHMYRVIYVCVLWFALDGIKEFKIRTWMSYSFFIYCSHTMLLQCAQGVCDIIIEKTGVLKNLLYVVEYVALPQVVILFLLLLIPVIKKVPKLYGVISGGR